MRATRLFSTVDTHTGGQPTRTITAGLPVIPGTSIAEKMIYLRDHMDWVRTALMFEPRGSAIMSGVVLTEPCNPQADIGVIFIETTGYLPMCGHDTIGVCTMLVETGMVEVTEPETTINLDTPGGLVCTRVQVEDGRAKEVTFRNVPSFVMAQNLEVTLPTFGRIRLDVAYGGNVYAIVSAENFSLEITPENSDRVVQLGRAVRSAVNKKIRIRHPEKEFVDSCTHVQFFAPPRNQAADFLNTVFFAENGIDRSPCGTGTSARVATLWANGDLPLKRAFVHESIIGSIFRATPVEETRVGNFPAVVVEVSGQAHLIGMSQFIIDPDDPLRNGFLLQG